MNTVYHVDVYVFKRWLQAKQIRPASLEDVAGTHHSRPLYKHPATDSLFVAMPKTYAAKPGKLIPNSGATK